MNDQEIASASANDRSQNWQEKDPRCWEGPVPVECTSASCGTCWVGVIAGNEKLSEVARRERRALKVFGYDQSDDTKPLIRLACQAKAYGNVTLVIPPWNAVFGKKVYGNVEELDLEPVTSSAKALREAVREAVASETSDWQRGSSLIVNGAAERWPLLSTVNVLALAHRFNTRNFRFRPARVSIPQLVQRFPSRGTSGTPIAKPE